jgi:hypothetical protein
MLKDVIDPEEKNQRKTDAIAVSVSWGWQLLNLTWRKR